MVDVLDRQVELVGMVLGFPVVFGTPVGEGPIQPEALGIEERDHPIVEQVGRSDGAFVVTELGGGHPAVGGDGAKRLRRSAGRCGPCP